MAYLFSWRMQLAAGLLTGTEMPIYSVAEAVGYESEASFSRAFRRAAGQSPGLWRQDRKRHGGDT
jgi:transcriptional regulator GlxA family with amidase domain